MRAMQVWDRQWTRSGQQTKGCGGKTPLFTHSEAPSAQSLAKWSRLFTNVLCDRLSVLFFRHAPQCFPLSPFSRKSRLLWMSEKLLGRIHSPIRWPGMLWCACGVLRTGMAWCGGQCAVWYCWDAKSCPEWPRRIHSALFALFRDRYWGTTEIGEIHNWTLRTISKYVKGFFMWEERLAQFRCF